MPKFGIAASGISTIAFYMIALVLNGAQYNTLVGKNINLFKSISKILVSGAIMSLSVAPAMIDKKRHCRIDLRSSGRRFGIRCVFAFDPRRR